MDKWYDKGKMTWKRYAKHTRPHGENVIKSDAILSGWLTYCRESRIYRLLEFFGLR